MVTQNIDLKNQSLQISRLGNISGANFELGGSIFLIKNNGASEITVTIIPAGQDTPVQTKIYPGWNPELVRKVVSSHLNLQYGY